jgi:hypothetical protein
MAIYTIIRVYEVPAENRVQATNRMLEAIVLHTERDYHKRDIIRDPGAQPGEGKAIDLRPTGWIAAILEQLGIAAKK